MKTGPTRHNLPKAKVWNRKAIKSESMSLALSHRWDALQTEDLKDEAMLNETAKLWVDTLNKVGEELHMLGIPAEQHKYQFDRTTKGLVKRARSSRIKLMKCNKSDVTPQEYKKLSHTSDRDNLRAKAAIKKFAKKERQRRSKKFNSLLLSNDGQSFHRLIQRSQGKQQGNMDNVPCFDATDTLVTSPKDILEARASYSEKLDADPTGISTDPTKWLHVKANNPKQPPRTASWMDPPS
ncbi:hypothetical protein PCASD_22489 [Puccinia coronata f. sp. avenae]|uniref:Uncharacterized protein n=1 Tax=Puccinia coronata f. sp. avenae TaxID=200324 RepID=A0A2N5TRH7_9BASI|nr:hypothetical protein PCASD_22489 [Puccinia coronata f. sp. avenae]